ncbi:MAG: hypothetical protein CME68_05230 [Halobacteriovoraceae bacterium]|nr:hypothetical protein [Halobacteriovoraceae bacterium]
MSNINQDLQATHKILTIIEQSKSNNDELLDHLPGIFCIIDEEAKILRGNLELSNIFKIDLEDLIEKDFSAIFSKEIWKIFKSKIDALEGKNDELQFELEIHREGDEESKSFYWYISNFSSGKENKKKFYSIVGEDISELRKKEKQLMEIFSSIPLGILTVGPNKKIEPQYSQFTEYLLDNKELDGKNLEETIFKETLENCEPEVREGVSNIVGSIGENDLIFESLKSTFPSKIWYPIKDNLDGGRWIGLTYQPVVYSGVVKRILVICEDRTKIIQSEEALKDSQMLEDKSIARILQIKKSDQSMLPLFMKELEELVSRLSALHKEEDSKEICNVLHGVKGNARVAGFDFLTSLSHELETFVLDKNKSENESKWKDIGESIHEIKDEWKEINSLYRSLSPSEGEQGDGEKVDSDVAELFERYSKMLNESSFSEDPIKTERMMLAIKSINFSSIDDLNETILHKAEKTAEKLGKKIEVNFDWSSIILEDYTKSSLSESLLHLVTNAISHGVEAPEKRSQLGKSETGQINIKAREKDGMIFLDVHDDGAGISFSSIVRTAVKRKIITLEKVTQISRSELLKLVFEPGFSTAQELTEISGRGVGMDVVAERVKELGGDITLDTKEGKGTRFSMSMRTGKKTEINRNVVSLSRFKNLLSKNISTLGQEKSVELDIDESGDATIEKGMIFCDMPRLTLAVTTYLGSFLKEGGSYKLKSFREGNQFNIHAECLKEGDDQSKWAEFSKPLSFCLDYLKKHGGDVTISDEKMEITFGHVLGKTDIPDLHVAFEKGISEEDAKITVERILSIKDELDLTLEIDLKPDRYTNLLVVSNPSESKELSLTLGASKASLQKELRKKVESIVSAIDRF